MVVPDGAACMVRCLQPAVTFARRHRRELAARPAWLFSSGPLGAGLADRDGRNVLQTTRPRESGELTKLLRPRGEQVFSGACHPGAPPAGIGERLIQHMAAARAARPAGDFRDRPAIDARAAQITAQLGTGQPPRQ
jgi:menaquinone-dependent protoporphyrinogen oxidase